MNAPRHDLYTAIHKAIRARIFETSARLSACNFADAGDKRTTLDHVRDTLAFLEEHAGHEDQFVQPRLADANPQLSGRVAEAHQLVEQTAATVARLASAIAEASTELAVERGPELSRSFNLLAGQHLAHMHEEETLVNAALWQAYTDEQLRELHGALQASIAPTRFAEWLRLMLPALNLQELIGVLGGMRAGAPPEVFESVVALGRETVGERWAEVERALG